MTRNTETQHHVEVWNDQTGEWWRVYEPDTYTAAWNYATDTQNRRGENAEPVRVRIVTTKIEEL